MHRCRGGLYTALIVLYAATSGIAGYFGSSYYKQMEGTNWVRPCCASPAMVHGVGRNLVQGCKGAEYAA